MAPDPTTLDAYDYPLSRDRIASRPARPRDSSRLMLVAPEGGTATDHRFRDLPSLLRPDDLLVVNEARVIPARLFARQDGTGRSIELLLAGETGPGRRLALVRSPGRLPEGTRLVFGEGLPDAICLGRRGEGIELLIRGEAAELLAGAGHVPLPPYIDRPDDASDIDDYQTIFARVPGAVAAPTAALHFSATLLEELARRGNEVARIVLRVGPGTFRPVRAADLRDHRVEEEDYSIPADAARTIRDARRQGRRILCVGTTCARALESWALDSSDLEPHEGRTGLTIVPPFPFRMVDMLLTNFHLPRSSLLLLVCAFGGRDRILAAYREAIAREYRFYSYGDAMLVA